MKRAAAHSSEDLERVSPPAPPRIPLRRRALRALTRSWTLLTWTGALAAAVWFYAGITDIGKALAHEEIVEVRASPSVSGRVVSLAVSLGATVRSGEPIAMLDSRDIDTQLRFARARLTRTRTRIAAAREEFELEARDRRAQAAARRANHEGEGRRIRAEIERLTAEQAADQAVVDAVTPRIDRLRPLAEGNLVTLDRLEALTHTQTVLQARIISHAKQIGSSQEELVAWKKLVPDAVVDTDLSARLIPFGLALKADEARIEELSLTRERYEVLSPATGVVNRISARPGEWCEAGDEIAELVVAVPGRVTAYVLGPDARVVETGVSATLLPRDRSGASLEGRVLHIGPRMELVPRQLRVIPSIPEWGRRVSIAIANPERPLPGEVYTVRFR